MSITSSLLQPADPLIDIAVTSGKPPKQGQPAGNDMVKILSCVSRAHFGGSLWRVAVSAMELKSSGIDTVVLMPIGENAEIRQFFDFHHIPYIECRLRAAGRIGRWRNNLRFLLGLLSEVRNLARVFRDHDPDLVHVIGATNIAPFLAAALTGHPILWLWNDMLAPRWIARGLKLLSFAPKTHVVVASAPVADYYRLNSLSSRYLGVLRAPLPPENLSPISNSSTALPSFLLPNDRPVLGFVSNLLKEKGAMDFIETLAMLRDRGVKVSGIMVGGVLSGHEAFHQKLLRRIRDLELDEQIILTGYRYDVMNMMRRFDVLLFPSHTDASPTVVTQALAAGVPIAATRVGDIPEALGGLDMPIVSVGDVPAMAAAVERLLKLDEPARRHYRRAAGARAAERCSVDLVMSRYLAVYNQAMATGRMQAVRSTLVS